MANHEGNGNNLIFQAKFNGTRFSQWKFGALIMARAKGEIIAGGNYRRNGTETRWGNKTLARVLKIYGSHVTNREVRRKMHELEHIVWNGDWTSITIHFFYDWMYLLVKVK